MNYPPPIPGLLVGALVVAMVAALECWVFVVMYRKTEKGPEGRHLFRSSLLLAVTFTLTVVFQFLGTNYWVVLVAACIQLVVFLGVAAEMWVRITLLREARIRAAKHDKDIDDFKITASDDGTGNYDIKHDPQGGPND